MAGDCSWSDQVSASFHLPNSNKTKSYHITGVLCKAYVHRGRCVRPKHSLNAMQILVFLWLCKKKYIYIHMQLVLYKNKSIEKKSPLKIIWDCFLQCKKTHNLSLVIYVLISDLSSQSILKLSNIFFSGTSHTDLNCF